MTQKRLFLRHQQEYFDFFFSFCASILEFYEVLSIQVIAMYYFRTNPRKKKQTKIEIAMFFTAFLVSQGLQIVLALVFKEPWIRGPIKKQLSAFITSQYQTQKSYLLEAELFMGHRIREA